MPPGQAFPLPTDEAERLNALRDFRIVGTPPEAEFDHIVQLAADLFHVPTALVTFVEEDRQYFKARIGFDVCETSRDMSFCTHALMSDEVLEVEDARADDRFKTNPLVTGAPFIRFYAGAPLVTSAGKRLGSVCIIDKEPRPPLTEHQKGLLRSLASIVIDHLERRQLDVLRRAAMRMAAATPDAIVCADDNGSITFWNKAAERVFGFSRSEAMGRPFAQIVAPDHHAKQRAAIQRVKAGRDQSLVGRAVEINGQRRDGTQVPLELSLAAWKDGDRMQFGSIIRDLSERKRAQERLGYLTYFDRLTGLPNRVRFLEKIDETLTGAGRFTVLKIGLDRFKAVNGSIGMAAGDLVLITAGQRVVEAAGPDAFVARLGGDEFGVLFTASDDPVRAASTSTLILDRLGEPFEVGEVTCHVGASIGMVLCPGVSHFDNADVVLQGALLALQHAKQEGGLRHELFRPQLGQKADERRRLEEELRAAFTRQEFELHYQPQVSLPEGRIVGAEALLRWHHPERGLLMPAAFLPILETCSIAVDVGRWIMRRACAFAADMAAKGKPIRMGVNLFAAQLEDARLYDDVTAALASADLPNRLLEIEITETSMLSLSDGIIDPLRRLRDLGIKIAFDDYGTGFASLSLLKRYPLTRLKIDREFVRDLETDPDDAAIVKAVLALGTSLGLDVIAEGIETTEQAASLSALGCREAQGYLFGKPMAAAEFETRLATEAKRIAA